LLANCIIGKPMIFISSEVSCVAAQADQSAVGCDTSAPLESS
jgi:hypothetical protein